MCSSGTHSQRAAHPLPNKVCLKEPGAVCLAEGTLPQKKKKKELLGATNTQTSRPHLSDLGRAVAAEKQLLLRSANANRRGAQAAPTSSC